MTEDKKYKWWRDIDDAAAVLIGIVGVALILCCFGVALMLLGENHGNEVTQQATKVIQAEAQLCATEPPADREQCIRVNQVVPLIKECENAEAAAAGGTNQSAEAYIQGIDACVQTATASTKGGS